MFKKFLILEWRAFTRSASFGSNLAMKIVMGLVALYFIAVFFALGVLAFELIRNELKMDPVEVFNKYMIYYLIMDLVIRLFLQKIPVVNIKPLLLTPVFKSKIVNIALAKTALSFFNFMHWFMLIPFCVVLLSEGYDTASVFAWLTGILCLLYVNNFLNIFLNHKDYLFIIFLAILAVFGAAHYYGLFDLTLYTFPFFDGIFKTSWMFAIPVVALVFSYLAAFRFYKANMYLDKGLAKKHEAAQTEQFEWLDQFGTIGTFLKNDLRLIKRNKRSKTTVTMSVIFLFYGMLFFSGMIEAYDNPMMHMFAGIFVTGGFLFTFGQFVPSWDSSYYPLMMSQNISYRSYLNAKWWLIVIATAISALLSSFYLYFGWHIYLMILVGAVYNIGVNSHLVLLGGAYTKTPVDLSSGKGAFGDKKAFNVKTMLITLPKLLLPMLLYWSGSKLINENAGLALVAIAGVLGFALRGFVFKSIEKIYKTEKYSTLQAYKQNNT